MSIPLLTFPSSSIIQPVCNMSVSPTYSITRAPLCVQGCMDKIIHCYPSPVVHCLLFSIPPPVVYHHFHPILTPTPPGSLLWLLSKWDQFRSVNTQVWDYSHLLLCAVRVCVSVYVCLCVHVHVSVYVVGSINWECVCFWTFSCSHSVLSFHIVDVSKCYSKNGFTIALQK